MIKAVITKNRIVLSKMDLIKTEISFWALCNKNKLEPNANKEENMVDEE